MDIGEGSWNASNCEGGLPVKSRSRPDRDLGNGCGEFTRIQKLPVDGIDPVSIQQTHQRVFHVAGGDDVIGFHFAAIRQSDTPGASAALQDLDDARVVAGRSPQVEEARLDRSGEGERAADGIPAILAAHPAERHDNGEERTGSAVAGVLDSFAEQGILKVGGKRLQRNRRQLGEER